MVQEDDETYVNDYDETDYVSEDEYLNRVRMIFSH